MLGIEDRVGWETRARVFVLSATLKYVNFYLCSFMFFAHPNNEVMNLDINRFKNDNRANPDNVIEHMLEEAERQIEKMTGKKVKLIAYEKRDYWF